MAPGRSHRTSLADALLIRTHDRVLGVLFGRPDRSFYASGLIRIVRTGSGAAPENSRIRQRLSSATR
jgi:hypothetical protein